MAFLPVFALILGLGICSGSVLGPMEVMWKEHEDSFTQEDSYPPYLMQFGHMLTSVTQTLLERHENIMDDRLKRLELQVDETCKPPAVNDHSVERDIETKLSKRLDDFASQISTLLQSFSDNLRQEFGMNIRYFMKRTEDKLSTLATKYDLLQVQGRLITLSGETSSSVVLKTPATSPKNSEKKLSSLATRDDLSKYVRRLDHDLQGIKNEIANGSLKEILNLTRSSFRSLTRLLPLSDSLAQSVNNCDQKPGHLNRLEKMLQALAEDVDDNGSALSVMSLALEDAEKMLIEKLPTLDKLTQQLKSEQQLAATASSKTSAPEAQGALSQCLDSEFVGGENSMDVCSPAVRFNKCHHPVIAYHCCRSCTDAGLTPEMGPHRYLNYPRKVNMFMGLTEGF